jgi:formimidoylglutamate deiminase
VELLFERALLAEGIARNVRMTVAPDGSIAAIAAQAPGESQAMIRGLALPGMPNVHSHAFQRAMAGRAETAGPGHDSFWTWREVMYRFLDRLGPEHVADIAAMAYVEMLEAGYTGVAEFHYLHHQPSGEPYLVPATLAHAVRTGAERAGIRLLLLPTLYQTAGFGGQAPKPAQRRFLNGTETFLRLVETLHAGTSARSTTGIALHSLRAVPPESLREVVAAADAATPIHMHIAEQRQEVADCLAWSGRRPVEFLLDTGLVDERWCLIHATHVEAAELSALAKTGAVVGLCPTTEGNLGDGRFPLDEWLRDGGRFGIGSDSQVSIDPTEELRLAEYTVRTWRERRVIAVSADEVHCGAHLYASAVGGGARAMGYVQAGLVVGAPADVVVLDLERPAFAGVPDDALLDVHLFAPRPGALREVYVGGVLRVRDGRHVAGDGVAAAYQRCLEGLAR